MYTQNHPDMPLAQAQAAPGPRRYRVLGMLPHLRKGPHEFFLRTALEYGGVAQLGRPDRLLVTHPDGVKHVLVDNHRNYIKGKYVERLRVLVGNGLPVSDGEYWLRQRRLMQPAFHRQRLASLATVITDLTAAMLDRWQTMFTHGQSFDVAAEMHHLTQRIIVKSMFGADLETTEVRRVGQAFATVMAYFNHRVESLYPLPESWPTPRNRRLQRAQHVIDQFVGRIIQDRRRDAADTGDLLSMLLAACDEETGEGMSNQQLYDEMRAIFFGGYDTTSNALAWIWYLLAQHPHVERRLYEELAAVLGDHQPTFQDLPNLTFLRMVIEEALRMYPPAWAIARTVVADDQIDGWHIPAGAKVVISPYVTHRLPEVWAHPETFDPERFAPERSAVRHRGAYLPFSIGPHLCIGSNLAMLEAQLIVATVTQKYRLCLVPGHPVQMYPGLILQPRHGIHVTTHPRPSH